MVGSARAWTATGGACGLFTASLGDFRNGLLGGSPVTLPLLFSGGVAVVLAVVLLGFLCSGGPLDICGSDILHICPRSRGAGLWVLTLVIPYFYGETLYTQVCSHSDPQVFRLRC
ncbi:hypothetical protein AMECASPLE_026439 [Ameca splendens]|uniref:Uncharacterized protein n=1 Tax=Ameca splendens TaxID=208324 RepID=A0ABV1A3I3_9TELE